MFTPPRKTLLLTAALAAAFLLAQNAHAAPPSVSLGKLKDNGLIVPGAITKNKANNSVSVADGLKPVQVPGVIPLIPGIGNLKPNPPGGGGGNGGGGGGNGGGNGGGGGGGGNPPSNPDWVDIVNGIGSLINPGGYGPGHHPGPHPGHYPGHYPGYVPGYPNPGSGSGYVPSNPLPEMPTDPDTAVVVTNPEKNGAPISFLAGGRSFTLAPGYQQVVKQGGSVEVRFDRGGSFGTARYTLRDGVFQFLVTDEGWNLFRKVYRVTLDNRENPFPFKYMVGNKVHQVPANGTREYEEDAPLVVKFDPGTGQAASRALDSGVYRIAVNPQSRLWDLMQADAEAGIPEVASNLPPSPPLPIGME